MLPNVVPFAAVCCHWNVTDAMPFGSASVPLPAVSSVPAGMVPVDGVTVGVPVGGCCGGAAVAGPPRAIVWVLPVTPPELFVATSVADFAPAGASGLNETVTVQLALAGGGAPPGGVPR